MGKLKAALYDFCMGLASARFRPLRVRVVSPAAGRVLEVGVGTGLNFEHYRNGTKVVGIEPNRDMLDRARSRASGSPATVHLFGASAEALPFKDGAFDEIVVTLVLCSVPTPAKALAEMHRVLKPGGRLRFLEHVRSSSSIWAGLQDTITPLWKTMADGCCPNRPTVESIEGAGFLMETVHHFSLGPYPTRPQVLGSASRETERT